MTSRLVLLWPKETEGCLGARAGARAARSRTYALATGPCCLQTDTILFYRIGDINTLLRETNDPFAAVVADVIELCAPLVFEEALSQVDSPLSEHDDSGAGRAEHLRPSTREARSPRGRCPW